MGISATPRQRVLWLIGILVVVLYALIPVVWMISLSLKTPASIGTDTGFFPKHATLHNYSDLFKQGSDFGHALINSFGIAGTFVRGRRVSAVLALLLSYAVAGRRPTCPMIQLRHARSMVVLKRVPATKLPHSGHAWSISSPRAA